jgi:hypothetical protein
MYPQGTTTFVVADTFNPTPVLLWLEATILRELQSRMNSLAVFDWNDLRHLLAVARETGWIPPPLMIRAFGAHCQLRTHAPQQTDSWALTSLVLGAIA